MSREHAHKGRIHASADGGDPSTEGRDMRQLAMMKRAQERKNAKSEGQGSAAVAEARHTLKSKVGSEMRETMYGALDVFQAMVRADERHEVEVSVSFGKVVGTKIADWLQDKALDAVKDSFELGETIVGGAIGTVFSSAKDRLESVADANQKIRASEAVDKIVAEARHATDRACKAAENAVEKISDEKMAAIAGVLELFEGAKDDADGEKEGTLRHAMQTWVTENLLGAPKTGGAAIHEHAVELYEVYSAEVSKGKPAREATDDAEDAMSGKLRAEAEEGAEKAEKKLGIEEEVEKDTHERERAGAVAGGAE